MPKRKRSSGKRKAAPRRRRSSAKRPSLGRQVGASVGGWLGDFVSSNATKLLGLIKGFGDYEITSNSLMHGSPAMSTQVPEFQNSPHRSCIVKHREFVQDISSSTAFTLQSFPINAGLSNLFPWVSGMADLFEEYRIRGMIMEFKSTSADALNSTNTALGTVIMATEYNTLKPNFNSKIQMENHEFATSCKPSESMIHPIECKADLNPLDIFYIRTAGSLPSGADQRFYDMGNFQIATVGSQAAAVIGELWVSYEIEFLKPHLDPSEGAFVPSDHYQLTGVTNSAPLGTNFVATTGSTGVTVLPNSTQIQFSGADSIADSMYYVSLWWAGGSVATVAPTLSFNATPGKFYKGWNGNTQSNITNGGSTTGTLLLSTLVYGVTPQSILTVGAAGTLPSSVTAADLWIVAVNPNTT